MFSTKQGKNHIDHIVTSGISRDQVTHGQSQFGLGYGLDHRFMHADVDAIKILKSSPGLPQQGNKEGERLKIW